MNMKIHAGEKASSRDGAGTTRILNATDGFEYQSNWTVEKWQPDQIEWARERLVDGGITVVQNGFQVISKEHSLRAKAASAILGRDVGELKIVPVTIDLTAPGANVPSVLMRQLLDPDEILEQEGNLLLNIGIQKVEDLLAGIGTAPTLWNAANAQIGVGDSTTAESASQTDLQASTNKTWVGMNSTYPSRASQTLSWQSDHTSSNYAWQEVAVRNGATAANLLNRKVTSLGTKTTGTWTITLTIALS